MRLAFARKAAVAATMAFGALAVSATGASAQDRLNFNGAVDLYDAPGSGGANLFIDFLVGGATGGAPSGTVRATETVNGAFAGEIVPGVTEGVIQDLTVSTGGVVGAPVGNFLTIGGYTFSLDGAYEGNTFGPISLFPIGNSTTATFGIFGTVTGGDFGATVRNFSGVFTAQFSGMSPEDVFNTINTGGRLEAVSFSAEFTAGSVVPEPSTYILLATGLGVIGLVGLRRRSTQV